LFHGFDTLGSPLEGRRVPWLRRETCPLASHKRTLIQLLTVNRGFGEFVKVFGDESLSCEYCFITWKCSWRCFVIFTWFTNPLSFRETIAEWALDRRSVSCFKTAGTRQVRGIVAIKTSGILRNLVSAVNAEARFGDLGGWWLSRMKSQRSRKDSVKGVASKVGFEVWTSNRLVNMWN
jgi:hypothetical protein